VALGASALAGLKPNRPVAAVHRPSLQKMQLIAF
jgi:hypothetical protein